MSETRSIKVWDVPTRLFHWLLVLLMIGAVVSIKIGGNAMEWHGRFGHMIFGLIVFRVVWGFVGGSTARFCHFVRGPASIAAYLRGQWQGIGHNPLGALSVLGLVGVLAFQATTGLFATDDIAFNGPLAALISIDQRAQITSFHRLAEWLIYILIGVHIAAVMFYTHVKKDNLIKPMITGTKANVPAQVEALRPAGWGALVVAVAITAAALWVSSGALNPPPPPPPPAATTPAW